MITIAVRGTSQRSVDRAIEILNRQISATAMKHDYKVHQFAVSPSQRKRDKRRRRKR